MKAKKSGAQEEERKRKKRTMAKDTHSIENHVFIEKMIYCAKKMIYCMWKTIYCTRK